MRAKIAHTQTATLGVYPWTAWIRLLISAMQSQTRVVNGQSLLSSFLNVEFAAQPFSSMSKSSVDPLMYTKGLLRI